MPTTTQVRAMIGFSEPAPFKPRFHANDTSSDLLNMVPREVAIADARSFASPASLDVEGFTLVQHSTAVTDFRDVAEIEAVHFAEIRKLLLDLSGADEVTILGRAILRFGERSDTSGKLDNSRPARLAHIDISDKSAAEFHDSVAAAEPRKIARLARYNVWRVLTPPPQDVPLAVCDARTIKPDDLIPADAVFDLDGKIVRSFESLVVRYDAAQRWAFYSGMTIDEALVFKTHDSDPAKAHHVPHGAFDDPTCPPGTEPRGSVEMRGSAFWYE